MLLGPRRRKAHMEEYRIDPNAAPVVRGGGLRYQDQWCRHSSGGQEKAAAIDHRSEKTTSLKGRRCGSVSVTQNPVQGLRFHSGSRPRAIFTNTMFRPFFRRPGMAN